MSGGHASAHELVHQALLPLAAVSADLHRRLVDYVLTGRDPEALTDLGACAREASPLLAPGAASPLPAGAAGDRSRAQRLEDVGVPVPAGVPAGGKGRGRCLPRAEAAVWSLRDRLYRCDKVAADQWVRLGGLLEKASQADSRAEAAGAPEEVPTWFHALVADLLCTVVVEHGPRGAGAGWRGARGPEAQAARAAWTPQRLSQVLAAGGVSGPQQPHALFLTYLSQALPQELPELPPGTTRQDGWLLPGVDGWLASLLPALPAWLLTRQTHQGRQHLVGVLRQNLRLAQACPHLVAALCTDASEQVRRSMLPVLGVLEPHLRQAVLLPVLTAAPVAQAADVIDFLPRLDGGRVLLDAAASSSTRITHLVAQVRDGQAPLVTGGGGGALRSSYQDCLVLPPVIPLDVGPEVSAEAAREELREGLAALARKYAHSSHPWHRTRAFHARRATQEDLDLLLAVADGRATGVPDLLRQLDLLTLMELAPSLTLTHMLRLGRQARLAPDPVRVGSLYAIGANASRIAGHADLRAVEDLMLRLGVDPGNEIERHAWLDQMPQLSWPWWACHLDRLWPRLLEASQRSQALETLGAFPRVPDVMLATVADIAVGSDSRRDRRLAQEALLSHPASPVLAAEALSSRSAERRAGAAAWISLLGDRACLPAVCWRLAGETSRDVRAALMRALEACGGGAHDVEDLLTPQALDAEASRSLKGVSPVALGWFAWEDLPQVRWAEEAAGTVSRRTVRWWVVLADLLKDPSGRGALRLYLSRLEASDRQRLAAHVVRCWFQRDEQCRDGLVQASEQRRGFSAASAVWNKGLLAFAVAMDGSRLADLARAHIRTHPERDKPVQAVLHALYANAGPEAVWLLVCLAHDRTDPLRQEAAISLCARLAAERGCDVEDLEDQVVPAPGSGEGGQARAQADRGGHGSPGGPGPPGQSPAQGHVHPAHLAGVAVEPEPGRPPAGQPAGPTAGLAGQAGWWRGAADLPAGWRRHPPQRRGRRRRGARRRRRDAGPRGPADGPAGRGLAGAPGGPRRRAPVRPALRPSATG